MPYLLYTLLLTISVGGFANPVFAQADNIGYDFDRPELIAKLPKRLKEISGLTLSPRAGELIAIQDEDGFLFRLDQQSGQLIGATEFWKEGDYEGVETVGQDIWIVKNTGTLYQVSDPGTRAQEVTKYNGFLSSDNDVEGLAYDRPNNRLLLACKATFNGEEEERSIFAFDLVSKQFLSRPVVRIGRDQISSFLNTCPIFARMEKVMSFINEKEKFKLGPSAIAIHPRTGQLFLASSAGKLIVVLNANGKIENVRRLDKDFFPQPEGLAFADDGTLYVSTEARDDEPARIYRLPYRP